MPRIKDEANVLADAPVTQARPAGHDGYPVPAEHDSRAISAGAAEETARDLAAKFIVLLETGTAPDGLFTPDVFCDFTMPQWRLQAQGIDDVVGMRRHGHPEPGRVPRSRFDATATGFVLEVEEQWESGGESWYCRELFRADLSDHGISQLSVYCTGDWDSELVARHAKAVRLLRS
jgi:hypothetical protein